MLAYHPENQEKQTWKKSFTNGSLRSEGPDESSAISYMMISASNTAKRLWELPTEEACCCCLRLFENWVPNCWVLLLPL